ncbi:MAG: hypothetical protein M1834_009453 [Cirrosporium novae-zelandiae]|nr:MAG: hypothetical protein M1834_009453 [Cirrosporium novae-zelandiae]
MASSETSDEYTVQDVKRKRASVQNDDPSIQRTNQTILASSLVGMTIADQTGFSPPRKRQTSVQGSSTSVQNKTGLPMEADDSGTHLGSDEDEDDRPNKIIGTTALYTIPQISNKDNNDEEADDNDEIDDDEMLDIDDEMLDIEEVALDNRWLKSILADDDNSENSLIASSWEAYRQGECELDRPLDLSHAAYYFVQTLCDSTGTNNALQCLWPIVKLCIKFLRSNQLVRDLEDTDIEELSAHGKACIVSIWLAVCYRMHTKRTPNVIQYPSSQMKALFDAAVAIVNGSKELSRDILMRQAIKKWESRLFPAQCEDRFNNANPLWYQEIPINVKLFNHNPRNQVEDRWSRILNEEGLQALAAEVIEQELITNKTCLNMKDPEAKEWNKIELFKLFCSIERDLLISMIEGTLISLDENINSSVHATLRKIRLRAPGVPGTYGNFITDCAGLSPTPAHYRVVAKVIQAYASFREDEIINNLANKIDQTVAPSKHWINGELNSKGYRRYRDSPLIRNTFTGGPTKNQKRRDVLLGFAVALLKRVEREEKQNGSPFAPFVTPICEIGYSQDTLKRLDEHKKHASSNYVMNLTEAILRVIFRANGDFILKQHVLYNCAFVTQAWLSEIALSRLMQGYVHDAQGFSHVAAGRSNGSALNITSERWAAIYGVVWDQKVWLENGEREKRLLCSRRKDAEERTAIIQAERAALRSESSLNDLSQAHLELWEGLAQLLKSEIYQDLP